MMSLTFDPALAACGDLMPAGPEQFLIDADRHLVERYGLREFMRLAWPSIEGGSKQFISNWHIDAISEYLMAVSSGQLSKLAIAMPPRHMKSLSVGVCWNAWDWILNPWRQFMCASYAQNLSFRDSVKTRRLISSGWYQARWGQAFQLTGDQNTKGRFENNKTGYRLATSVNGQLTGEGGDCIVVDDAHNVRQAESEKTRTNTLEWWDEAMATRLNDPKRGAFVLVQQRVHENDLMGHVMRSGEGWEVLCLPAEFEPDHPARWHRDPRKELGELLWPARMGRTEIEGLKHRLGPYATAAQLQQRPSPRAGGIFKRHWFSVVEVAPADLREVRGWDMAGTEKKTIKADPDWSVAARVGWSPSQACWYITDVQRWREEEHTMERIVQDIAAADGFKVLIHLVQDPGASGKGQAQKYARILSRYQVAVTPAAQSGDKMQRALLWAGKAGAGLVKIVKADWNKAFLDEITSFPTGSHDDQVDALSTAFEKLVSSDTGMIDYYEDMLRKRGIDPATVKTALEKQEEAKAEEQRRREEQQAMLDGMSKLWGGQGSSGS